jgi:large repetitive protein
MKPHYIFAGALFLGLAASLLGDWQACSIGPTSQTSIEINRTNDFTLTALGSPLAGQNDGIGFASGPGKLSGDCEIVAHVIKITPGKQAWAAGGIMMRESLGGGAKFIAVGCTRAHGVQSFIRSEGSDNVSQQENCSDCLPPLWLKIVRHGDHFTSYKSTDGVVWLQVNEADVVMKKTVWVGAFATSGGDAPAAEITFERVTTR